ncbi:MAG: protein kinase [Kofleriaceae bacterium]
MAASETLRTVLDASRRLDELTTARVILKIAEQVHAAQHKAGAGKAIGPVTPASISIEPAGAVKLGLAEPNAFAYAAPEQLGASEGDRRSDVWSLGVVMWEALTHSALFEGGDDDAVKAAVRQQTIDPPAALNANIPQELSAICMRALSRNPADRYQSAKVMGAEIEAVLDDAGYGDSDDKVREFMATLGQPKREVKLTTPPLITPAQGVGVTTTAVSPAEPADMLKPPHGPSNQTAPGMVIPRGDDPPPPRAPTNPITVGTRAVSGTQPPKPSILDQEPTEPPSSMLAASAGSLGADTQRTVVETKPVDTDKTEPPTAASVGLSAAPIPPVNAPSKPVAAGANLASALANAGSPPKQPDRSAFQTLQGTSPISPVPSVFAAPAAVPMAPVLPATAKPPEKLIELPKAASAATALGFASADHGVAKPSELEGAAAYRAKIDQVAIESAAKAKAEAPTKELPKKTDPTPAPRKRAPTGNPDPASVVTLPKGRDSQEVLGGWGWGTDSHPAIKEYEGGDDDHPANKKTLIYIFGGLLGVAAIIVVVAFAFGGSKSKPKPETAATPTDTGSGSATAIAYGSGVAYGSATGDPTGGSAIGSASGSASGSGSADAVSAAGSAAGSDTATGSATGSAVAVASTGSATMTGTTTTDANPNTPTPKIPEKVAAIPVKTPDKVVKPPVVKPPVVKPPEKHVTTTAHDKHPATHDPVTHPHPVVAEGPTPTAKADAETAYRQGLQQFARGDSNGALSSLRISLASNPSYAPTWRGLGLVFEKMGEKDQARSAFKRYLQLAPTAGDADQIRNRMERLGS